MYVFTCGLANSNLSTLMIVNVRRNGPGAQCKPLKLLTFKTDKIHLN